MGLDLKYKWPAYKYHFRLRDDVRWLLFIFLRATRINAGRSVCAHQRMRGFLGARTALFFNLVLLNEKLWDLENGGICMFIFYNFNWRYGIKSKDGFISGRLLSVGHISFDTMKFFLGLKILNECSWSWIHNMTFLFYCKNLSNFRKRCEEI